MKSKSPQTPFSMHLSGSSRELELRLRNIFQWRRKRPPVPLFLLITVLVLSCCGLVSCRQEQPGSAQTPDIFAPEEPDSTLYAFGTALWEIYQQRQLPNGEMLIYQFNMESAENNTFAVCDVDGDGRDELILRHTTGPTAEMCEWVYGYSDGELVKKLAEFPGLTYYDNGTVTAPWSHNQDARAAAFWPYFLFRYDAALDRYESIGGASSWVRQDPDAVFPSELDADADGTLYYIFPADWDGQYSNALLADGTEYESWRASWLGDAQEITPEFLPLTRENIAALGCPEQEWSPPEPAG